MYNSFPPEEAGYTEQEAECECEEHRPLLTAEGVVEDFCFRCGIAGEYVADHVALEEFNLGDNLEGTVALPCDDGLGEVVHRLLDEELLLDGNLAG